MNDDQREHRLADGEMHGRMLKAVETLTEEEREAVAKFLHGLIRSLE